MVKELQNLSTKSSLNNSLLSNVWLININNHLHLFQIRSTSSLGRYTGSFPALSTFHNPKLSFEYHHYSPLTFSPAFLSAVTLSCFCAPNSLCWGHLHCRETLPGPSGETQPFVLPGKAAILQLLLKEKHPVLSLHSTRTAQLHNLWRHVAGHWHKVFPQLCINTLDFLLQRYTNVGILNCWQALWVRQPPPKGFLHLFSLRAPLQQELLSDHSHNASKHALTLNTLNP